MNNPALLALEDGSIFNGRAIGGQGYALGEVVFNTAMTGYQEILSDPSYAEQMVTFTTPHIGNVGVNDLDLESKKIFATGLIIKDYPLLHSNWRATQSLNDWLVAQKVVGIADVDTRRLTRLIREKGALRGCITTDINNHEQAIEQARGFAELIGRDLAKEVTTGSVYTHNSHTFSFKPKTYKQKPLHIVVYDFGVKTNILNLLYDRVEKVTVVPAQTPVDKVLKINPDGVFLSNGPGDPAACSYAIDAIKKLLELNIPLFGICLGHQLLALASGAKTEKMKFGHHGANHPVKDCKSGEVYITSQNHGFSVNKESLPSNMEITHVSLFDQTIQGLRRLDKPAFGFQGHPEASPGPKDIYKLFDDYISMIETQNQ